MAEAIQSSDSNVAPVPRLTLLGRILFTAGIVLLVVRGMTLTRRMPGLPSFWYSNQPMWVALGIGLIVLGWQALWNPRLSTFQSWRPSIPGRRFRTSTLYVAEGCHLCDDAAAILKTYQEWLPAAEQIDIRSDPELVSRFSACVPVVVFDGKVRFRGRIQEGLLRRLIEGTTPLNLSTSDN